MEQLWDTTRETCNFIEIETLALVFSYEFCEVFKNNYLYRTTPVAASRLLLYKNKHGGIHFNPFSATVPLLYTLKSCF